MLVSTSTPLSSDSIGTVNIFFEGKTVGEIPTALHFINFAKKRTN